MKRGQHGRAGQGLRDEEREREGTRWEIGKGKGMRRVRALGLERGRTAGGLARHEGKGRSEFDEQRVWEEWCLAKEEGWWNEHWGELSGDDLDMGEVGQRLRQEQWEEVRSWKMRDEGVRMAVRLGDEMGSELSKGAWKGGSRRRERGRRVKEQREKHREWEEFG